MLKSPDGVRGSVALPSTEAEVRVNFVDERSKRRRRLGAMIYPRRLYKPRDIRRNRRIIRMNVAVTDVARSKVPHVGLLGGARNVAQRRLTKIAAGIALGFVLLVSRGARADERTEARAHFKKGMAAIADGKLRRRHRGAEEGLRDPSAPERPLQHRARVRRDGRPRERGRLLQEVPRGRTRRTATRSRRSSRASRSARASSRRCRSRRSRRRRPGPCRVRRVPGAGGTGSGDAPGRHDRRPPGPVAGSGRRARAAPPGPRGSLKTEDVFEETVVTASKAAQSPLDAPNSTSIITEQDIRLSGITKIPELLRRLAGVDIMEITGAQTEVSMRGFNQRLSNKILVLVNGRSVYVDILGVDDLGRRSPSASRTSSASRSSAVPGSALYGADAFNGVINIITKPPGEGRQRRQRRLRRPRTRRTAPSASTGATGELRLPHVGRLRLPAALEPRGPAGRQFVHDVRSTTRTCPRRTVRLDGEVTRHFGKDVDAGVFGGVRRRADRDPRHRPAQRRHRRRRVTRRSPPWRQLEALRGPRLLDALARDERHQRGDHRAVAPPGELRPERRRRRGPVHRPVRDRAAASTTICTSARAYRFKDVEWTYLDQDQTENHVGLFVHDEVKIGRQLRRRRRLPRRLRAVPRRASSSRRAARCSSTRPSKSTIRGIVATAFRTPTFLESYLGFRVQLPVAGAAISTDAPTIRRKRQPEQIFTTELGYLNSESDYFTFDSAFFYNHANNLIELADRSPLTVGDLANRRPERGARPRRPACTRSSSAASRTSARATTCTAPSSASARSRSKVSTSTPTTRS